MMADNLKCTWYNSVLCFVPVYHFVRRGVEKGGFEGRRGLDTVFFKLRWCFPSFPESEWPTPWSNEPPTNLARKLDLGLESLSALLKLVVIVTPVTSGPPAVVGQVEDSVTHGTVATPLGNTSHPQRQLRGQWLCPGQLLLRVSTNYRGGYQLVGLLRIRQQCTRATLT